MKKADKKMTVVFVDDEDVLLASWRDSFESAAPKGLLDLKRNSQAETKRAVAALDIARVDARNSKKIAKVPEAALFNDADLVFVDYDLIALEDKTALTGEDIAYLLRCFTTCGFIVLLNPPDLGTNFFDLRLRRSLDSWADLVLGTEQLGNTWFWRNEPTGFSPWSWPNLMDAVARRERQVQSVRNSLESSILDILKIPEDACVAMDHAMADPVSTRVSASNTGERMAKLQFYTLREFVFKLGYGVHRHDIVALQKADEQVARIAAARLSSWLEHVVLPAQSMLIDAPHLVARLPGLITGDPSKVASWNATTVRDFAEAAGALRVREIKPHRFGPEHWLSHPVWYWPRIAGDNRYVQWAQVDKMADVAFCEDTSMFVKRSEAHEFMAEVPPQFALRYVQMEKTVPELVYRPSVRFSM